MGEFTQADCAGLPLSCTIFNGPRVEGGGAVNPAPARSLCAAAPPRRLVYGRGGNWGAHKRDEKVAEIYKAAPDRREKEKIKPESIKQAPITRGTLRDQ